MVPNFIIGPNPFHLAGPPKWWLRQLWDFDKSLVVIPSKQGFYYRLAQRRKLNLSEKVVNEAIFKESDTKLLASYSLVPVTTILATANWSNPYLFVELANRAPWRQGGADKVMARIESQEAAERQAKDQYTDEHLTALSRDGWRSYRKKQGLGRTIFTNSTSGERPRPPMNAYGTSPGGMFLGAPL